MFWKRRVYLDYASAAPVSGAAGHAYRRASAVFGNPSSPHTEGREARALLEEARRELARLVEAKPDDIIFTSGATEANNLAIRGLVKPGSHVLYLPSAHASVIESVRALEGVVAEPVPIREGRIDIAALTKCIRPGTALITLDAVCGETGTVWDTRAVRMALDTLPTNRPMLHVDASQAPLTQKIIRAHFGADLLTLDAQKVGGMRGAGALIAPRTLSLTPIIVGGGQERGLRSGTPVAALIVAFVAALTDAVRTQEAFLKSAGATRERLIKNLLATLPGIYINEGAEVAPNILNISLPGRDTDYLVTLLDVAGFAVSTRSACESDSTEGSRAVYALTPDRARSFSTLRISWGPSTKESELMRFHSALVEAVQFIDNERSKSHY